MDRLFEYFTKPTCKKCGVEAVAEMGDNRACGDPDCCGIYEEWVVLVCPKCNQMENLHAHL